MSNASKTFFIYNDTGTNKSCVHAWQERLTECGISASCVSSHDIIRGDLKHAQGLIMPGGADVPYCKKLNGAGTAAIRTFVHESGIYIGSCAGAYFAHESIEWHNADERIMGVRELAFFKGTARGPLVTPYSPLTSEGLAFVELHYRGKTACVYYKGGPIMHTCRMTEHVADFVYKGMLYPAIVKKTIGRGIAIAISPHIEYTESFLASINAPPCPHRHAVFSDIMTELLAS